MVFVSIFDMDKPFFCTSYHLYRIFRWSTILHKINALGRVTITPIFRRTFKVGPNFKNLRHRNMWTRQWKDKSAVLCFSWLAGGLDCPQVR